MRLFNYFFCLIITAILMSCSNDSEYNNELLNIKQIKTIDNIDGSTSVVDFFYGTDGELEGYKLSNNGDSERGYKYNFYNSSLEVVSDTLYVNNNYKKVVKRGFYVNDISNLLTEASEVKSSWDRGIKERSEVKYVLNYDSSDKIESVIGSDGTKHLYTWAGTLLVRIEYFKNSEPVWVGNLRYDESVDNVNTNLDLFREFAINLSILPKLFEGVPLNLGLRVACLPQFLEVTTALGKFNYSFSYDFNKDNNISALEVCGEDDEVLKSVEISY